MKAAVLERLGDVPAYRDVDDPVAADGTVVADVRAVAIKNIERMLAAGTHYGSRQLELPAVVGLDAVVTLPDGRRVYAGATPPGGAMAERMVVHPQRVLEVPEDIDDASAAALPNGAVSAWFALEFAGRIQPGQNVLVLGATGVTGGFAVQLARHRFGAEHVVAVGRDEARLRQLADSAATATIRWEDNGIEDEVRRLHREHPFDVVLDYLWGRPAEQTLRALSGDDLAADFHRTRYVQIGEMAGPTIELPAAALRSAGIELVGQGGGSVPREAFARVGTEMIPAVFDMAQRGTLTLETVCRPLEQVTDAWTEALPSGARMVLQP